MNESSLLVLTQNAWARPLWAPRRERLARSIADHGPDVVGLQEVHAATPGGEESQAHELAALVGGYDVWSPRVASPRAGTAEGVALLVKKTAVVVDRSVSRSHSTRVTCWKARTSGWRCAPPSVSAPSS